jgi:ATP-dependent RNA helicase DeaD
VLKEFKYINIYIRKDVNMDEVRFEDLGLRPEIMRAVKKMGFEEASPIQAKAIPVMMSGRDLIGQAQTGTGKTAAFGIPLLEKLDPKNKKLQAIVLCPTRELAIQVAEEIRHLAYYMHGIKVLPIYGGQEIVKQIRSLKGGVNLIIGTPGRVMDHMRRRTIKMEHLHTVVLDEADEMLNMGFREDIETILEEVPAERQTVLFSATMPKPILDITKKYQQHAEMIKVTKRELTVPNIEQFYYEVKPKNKEEVLSRILDIYNPKLSVVFCNTKKQVDLLVNGLLGRGYFAAGLHGDMKQAQRDRVMEGFRKGKTDILVATDVAARGIDVDEVEAVFNYDLPQDDEYYVHRIGRTGRAGRVGRSFSFVSGREVYKLKEIQRYCKTKIYAQKVPSLNDVANTKIEKLMDRVNQMIEEEDLTTYLQLIQSEVNASDYTSMDIAAALLKLCAGGKEEPAETFADTGAEEPGMVRLFINIGKRDKAKPGDILGALAGESGIPGKVVGTIDMYDKYTFVEVPTEYAREIINSVNHTKIKGKPVAVEPANQK